MASSFSTISLALLLPTSLAFPFPNPFLNPRDTGSSTSPYCFYNQGCSDAGGSEYFLCRGAPIQSYCSQAINATCLALTASQPSDGTNWATRIGNGTNDGPNADCVAVARNGKNPIPDMNTCLQAFYAIMGCFQTTNVGFGDNCVGGTTNLGFCTTSSGIVDDNLPMYQLGVPTMVNQENLNSNPPGVLGAGNGDASSSTGANRVSASVAGPSTESDGAESSAGRGGAAGGGGTDPE